MKEALYYATLSVITLLVAFWIADRIGVHWMIVMPFCFFLSGGLDVVVRRTLRRKE